jgi:hypothetical protein
MLVALALYISTAHAGIPAGFGGTPGVSPNADPVLYPAHQWQRRAFYPKPLSELAYVGPYYSSADRASAARLPRQTEICHSLSYYISI